MGVGCLVSFILLSIQTPLFFNRAVGKVHSLAPYYLCLFYYFINLLQRFFSSKEKTPGFLLVLIIFLNGRNNWT